MNKKYIPFLIVLLFSYLLLSCASVEARAAAEGDIEPLRLYLNEGGDVDAPQSWGRTLLIISAESNQLKAVEYLLMNGADPELVAENGKSVIISASIRGRYEIVDYLIQRGVNINRKGRNDSTALHYASLFDKNKIVRLLLESGADYTLKNKFGWTALLYAIDDSAKNDKGITKSTEYLLRAGSHLDINSNHIDDIAFNSASSGNLDVLKLLISYGFDIKITDLWRNSLLFPAVEHPHFLSFLIDEGLSINYINFDGLTVLFEALDKRYYDSISLLLNKGADTNITDKRGKTVLIEVADKHKPNLVRKFIIAGANPFMVDYSGNNALHYAALKGDYETVRLLLIAGLDPNQKNGEGLSPLSLAEQNEEFGLIIIDLLISAGAIIEE